MRRPTAAERAAIKYLAGRPVSGTLYTRSEDDRVALRTAINEAFPGAIARAQKGSQKDAFEDRFVGNVPAWAKRYVRKYGARVSRLTIRRSATKPYSSGHCWYGSGVITVTLGGGDDLEQKAVVLHEIAHANAPGAHDDAFYAEWHRLLALEGLLRGVIESGRYSKGVINKLRKRPPKARLRLRAAAAPGPKSLTDLLQLPRL
jgi:hypothetical protein